LTLPSDASQDEEWVSNEGKKGEGRGSSFFPFSLFKEKKSLIETSRKGREQLPPISLSPALTKREKKKENFCCCFFLGKNRLRRREIPEDVLSYLQRRKREGQAQSPPRSLREKTKKSERGRKRGEASSRFYFLQS